MSKRRKNDFYPTPSGATRALMLDKDIRAGLRDGMSVLEPCVGAGDMARIISDYHAGPLTVSDLDTKWDCDFYADASKTIYNPVDWVITNPPFSDAMDVLKNLYPQAREGLALLLRVSFSEPTQDRGDWLQQTPPSKIIHVPRISFTGDGKTDSVHTAWFIWFKNYKTSEHYATITKEDMRKLELGMAGDTEYYGVYNE